MRNGVVETSHPYIYFHVEYERLSAVQVRDLGTLLLSTADELDDMELEAKHQERNCSRVSRTRWSTQHRVLPRFV
ncbi:MAG TPA: hypothetical protein VIJ31_15435 [Acidothermaceae bacterium]